MQTAKASTKKLYWSDIREKIHEINPDFARQVDELDPGKEFPLYLCSYPYGSTIVNEGVFSIPNDEGELVQVSDASISQEIKDDLAYVGDEIPAGMVLGKSIEIFVSRKKVVFPWLLYAPGQIFGLWSELSPGLATHPVQLQHITAGARSIFMLPHISNAEKHNALKRDFGLQRSAPQKLFDHWAIFRDLVKHPETKCDWQTELLFFPGKWLETIQTDRAWQDLRLQLLNQAWKSTSFWRNQMFYDFAFSCAQANRNMRPNPYIADTVKHLVTIGIGAAAGIGTATNNLSAPVDTIQKIYLESYQLKSYAPTIMLPINFDMLKPDSKAYYSLQYPTTIEFAPRSRQPSSTIYDLAELKHILQTYLDEIASGNLKIDKTIVGELVNRVQFDFFHCKEDKYGEVRSASELPIADNNFIGRFQDTENSSFPAACSFVRGCVRLLSK